MYENSFGVPDTLPAGYGGSSAPTVRMNAGTPAVAHSTPSRPMTMAARPLGQVPTPAAAVVRFSDLEDDDEDDLEDDSIYEYEFSAGYGGFGAAKIGPPIKRDKKLKLKYRDWDDGKGYVYRQYSNGTYAIVQGKAPKGITANIPFTAKENAKAFDAIKAQVEGAIGPFPAGAKPSKASKKKGKKKGKKVDVGKLAQVGLESAGKIAGKFQPSGSEAPATDAEAEVDTAPAAEESVEAWYARKFFGVPTWGWLSIGAAAGLTIYLATRKTSGTVPPPPAAAPKPPAKAAAAPKALPAPAPAEAEAAEESEE